MNKKKPKSVNISQERQVEIVSINPFEVIKKIRKPLPPPSKSHRDKTKYSRKKKHPKNWLNQQ